MSRNLRMDAGVLSFNDLTIDPIAREVHLHQQPVELTPREFDLLYFFARHPGGVLTPEPVESGLGLSARRV